VGNLLAKRALAVPGDEFHGIRIFLAGRRGSRTHRRRLCAAAHQF
jgi:hypothetical protein